MCSYQARVWRDGQCLPGKNHGRIGDGECGAGACGVVDQYDVAGTYVYVFVEGQRQIFARQHSAGITRLQAVSQGALSVNSDGRRIALGPLIACGIAVGTRAYGDAGLSSAAVSGRKFGRPNSACVVDQVCQRATVDCDIACIKAIAWVFVEGEGDGGTLANRQCSDVAGEGHGGRRGVDADVRRVPTKVAVASLVGEGSIGHTHIAIAGVRCCRRE